jgi:hypothetical protein
VPKTTVGCCSAWHRVPLSDLQYSETAKISVSL